MGWTDKLNQKLKALMQGYLEHTNGRVHLAEILAVAEKTQMDLPTLPKYVQATGRPFLCWSGVLGRCTYCKCRSASLPMDITVNFANRVIDVIGKGVDQWGVLLQRRSKATTWDPTTEGGALLCGAMQVGELMGQNTCIT
jgi:hypothetical protein